MILQPQQYSVDKSNYVLYVCVYNLTELSHIELRKVIKQAQVHCPAQMRLCVTPELSILYKQCTNKLIFEIACLRIPFWSQLLCALGK